MYHIVYLTTNLVNDKFYIGVHSTYNLEDGYLGSGIAILRAIKKYGKKSFKQQILFYCLNADDAYNIEKNIVDYYFINNCKTYNLVLGGDHDRTGRRYSIEARSKMSKTRIEKGVAKGQNNNGSKTKMSDEKRKEKAQKANATKRNHGPYIITAETRMKLSMASKGKPKPHTEEQKRKLREHRRKLLWTSPAGEKFITQSNFIQFCKEHNLSKNIIQQNVNKGIISIPVKTKTNKIRPLTTLNCNGWEVVII